MFYDLPNVLAILIVVLACFRLGLIPLWITLILGAYAFAPFLLNDVLFPATYMPDQFLYFRIVHSIREFDLSYTPFSTTVDTASWFFAFIPLPFVETIQSLGFYNRFLVTILIVWLYSVKHVRGLPLLLLLMYPSLLLYSSLALRDTLIFFFMMLSVIFFIENKRALALLITTPLFFIKFQNFFLMIVFFVVYLTFTRGSIFYKLRYFLLPLVLASLAPFIMSIIEVLNFYRRAMFIEDGGDDYLYQSVTTLGDFLVMGLQSAPYFLIKPLPWETENLFQFIQSLENFILVFFLFFIFYKSFRIDRLISIKWFFVLLISLTIYGLVVFNYGTAVRYKFPFVLITVVGLGYDLYLRHGVFLCWSKK